MRFWPRFTILSVLMVTLLLMTGQTTFAKQDNWYTTRAFLLRFQGDWYDGNGNKVLTIDGRKFNDAEVVASYNLMGTFHYGTGVFRIKEKKKYRNIHIDWKINGTNSDFITVDRGPMLNRAGRMPYESICGIHLGMTRDQVKAKLGEPTRVLNSKNTLMVYDERITEGIYYEKQGLILVFNDQSVDRIILLKSSTQRLKVSGLNCNDSPEAFRKAYSLPEVPVWPTKEFYKTYPIGRGENLFFGNDMLYLILSVYET